MAIKLSEKFTYKKLLRFTLPSVIMMIFSSVYGVVDGFFVVNYAGEMQFAAVNFIMPFLMILGGTGFMFGTGGSALVAKFLGEQKAEKANRLFSMFVYVSIAVGVVLAVIGVFTVRPVALMLGATESMLDYCVVYGRIILAAIPFYMLQVEFQSFCITAEKPKLSLLNTLIAGVANMILDALLVGVFHYGVAGAAVATAISQAIGGIIPLIYFFTKNKSLLRLTKMEFDLKNMFKGCLNGSSELMTNISASIVGMLYNAQLMKFAQEMGVSAYGVLMYVSMIFCAVFIGYSIGVSPIVSYNFGAQNKEELKNLLKKSSVLIGICSVLMVILCEAFAEPLSALFANRNAQLFDMTLRGFRIYAFAFLFCGASIFGSSFFTALNDGIISAVISFLRTLVFQIAAVLILPVFWQLDGIWMSIVVAELLSFATTLFFITIKRKKYGYM